MLRVALKGLLGHKLRFALTAFSVVLGVTFVSGSFVFTDSIQRAFDGLFDDVFAEADIFVNAAGDEQLAPGATPTVEADLVDRIAGIAGVQRAAGYVDGSAIIVDDEGEPVGTPGAPGLAESFDPLSPVDIAIGAPPTAPDEVAIDRGSAEQLELEVGDDVQVFVGDDTRTFTVTGITSFGSTDNLLGATIVSFELATAQDLFDKVGVFDGIGIVLEDGADPDEVRSAIASELAGEDVEVVTAEQEADSAKAEIAQGLGFLTTALLVFGAVAVFVASFIIANTFSIVVAQRSREFALLRALGASRRQIRWSVVAEAAIVGLVASLIGIGLGALAALAIREAMDAFGLSLPSAGVVLAGRTIVVSILVGTGVTLLASVGAARRASRVSPVEALADAPSTSERRLRGRIAIGALVLAAGVVLLVVGLVVADTNQLQLVGAGAATTLLGVALVAPLFAGPVAALLGGVAGAAGVAGLLASRNARRDRRRTAATASALMIGLSLVTMVTVLTATIQGQVAAVFEEQFTADVIIQSTDFAGTGLPPSLVAELADRDEIEHAVAITFSAMLIGEDRVDLTIVDVAGAAELLGGDERDLVGSVLGAGELLVPEAVADDRGLDVGDELELTFADGQTRTVRLGGVYDPETTPFLGGPVLGRDVAATEQTGGATPLLVVSGTGEAEATRAAVDDVVADIPLVMVQDQAEFREQQQAQIDGLLNLFIGLLALALLIALFGIANTLALAVFERTREIGLLRAVGVDRRQAGIMIVAEAVIVSVFGALLGLAVGVGFALALLTAIGANEGIELAPVLPAARLLAYVVLAAMAGAVAAIFPAWRAARLDVLRAVTAD